ncbi:STM3941 family protein [Actinomyces sp. ZJ308]|uniref:STM3941 family protein n=1 Tax=Actinomyces sp. ZJ308 TaxID=2708342 RepID=UPI00141ED932|nr:STM3941 family protein [Actinomyces sp. ZJ308]
MGTDTGRVRQQSEQLRTTGMLVIPESPLRLWGTLLGCVAFTVVGVVVLLIANQSSSPLLYMLAGIACIGFFGVVGIPGTVRKILRRSRLVVTPEGVRLERRTGQSYVVNESARWTDIAEFFGEEISPGGGARGQLVIGYTLTPLGQQMRSHDPATPQLSQQVNEMADRGTVREGRVYLPATLDGGKEDLLAVLQQAHQTYGHRGRP